MISILEGSILGKEKLRGVVDLLLEPLFVASFRIVTFRNLLDHPQQQHQRPR